MQPESCGQSHAMWSKIISAKILWRKDNVTAKTFQVSFYGANPPPPQKYYEKNSLAVVLCNFGGRLRQDYVITKRPIPQEIFCVLSGCRDLRLFHAEVRHIDVTPEK